MTTKQSLFSFGWLVLAMLCTYTGLVLWIGSIVFFGSAVASVVFKLLPSKGLAGALNTTILSRLNAVEHVAAVALLIGVVTAYRATSSVRRGVRWHSLWRYRVVHLVPLIAAVLMITVMIGYVYGIAPQMNTLRQSISSFDAPKPDDVAVIAEFRSLHVLYSRMVIANVVLGITVLVWQTLLFARYWTACCTCSSLSNSLFSAQPLQPKEEVPM